MSSFDHYYDKGIAIGVPEIITDCITFFYKDEEYSVPTYPMLCYPGKAKFTGSFYEAKIADVRKVAKERH